MIFLSYVSEDRDRVVPFYDLLESHGYNPWMDCKKLVGGQNWDYEIKTALERSDLVVVFVSNNSVDKSGYAQREIRLAIDKYEEKIAGDIYIIPVQLDEGDFPRVLRGIQFIKAFNGNADDDLLKSIEAASHRSKQNKEVTQTAAEVRWSVTESKSSYSSIPGYSTNINKISISSHKYANINDIADHINGYLAECAMATRVNSLAPDPSIYNLMQDEWRRTDTFDGIFTSATVVGRIISITYSLHWYFAGAAHPTHAPRTFNYLLEPVTHLRSPKDLFIDDTALKSLQEEIRSRLTEQLISDSDQLGDISWIERGTASWDDLANFGFNVEGMVFQFSSYQVACYAAGMPTVTVPYSSLVGSFKDSILYALNLYRPHI